MLRAFTTYTCSHIIKGAVLRVVSALSCVTRSFQDYYGQALWSCH